ncbi:Dihydroflavonol-4-reductase [Dactylella cylindrospora]|nr:Dihydroflavonol-4-reductase [Dactylella cylindrospora]
MAPSDYLVLITGASGFVGSGVTLAVLNAGYKVRLTVRTESQIAWLKQVFKHEDQVSWIVVPDFLKSGAFDEAVKGVDYVIHTASPIPKPGLNDWRTDYIDPAVIGTEVMLYSALTEPKVKKVVVTSSCISFVPMDRSKLEGKPVNETMGLPHIDVSEIHYPFAAYHASKNRADIATVKFREEKRPPFAIVTIHPDYVYGAMPILKDSREIMAHDTTAAILWREYNGIQGLLRFQEKDHSVHIDDVAAAHVKVLDDSIKDGEKYLLSSGEFKWDDLLEYAQKEYPNMVFKLDAIPDWKAGFAATYVTIDGSKAEKELGIKYKDIYQQFKDLADQQIELLKKDGRL